MLEKSSRLQLFVYRYQNTILCKHGGLTPESECDKEWSFPCLNYISRQQRSSYIIQ